MDQLSAIFQNALTRRNLSQAEAAQLANIERKTFNSYVLGRTEPDLPTLKKIIKVLGIEREIAAYLLEQNVPNREITATTTTNSPDYLAGKLAAKEEVIAEKEARRLDAVSWAEKSREDKEHAEKEKDRLYGIIEKYLVDIHSNSKEIAEDISALTNEIQAEHRAMMDSVDVAAKQPIGTTRANAHTVELAYQREQMSADKKSGVDKKTELGKRG